MLGQAGACSWGIKPAVGVTNFVVCLARTVFGNDDNNNGQDTSTF